MLLVCAVGIGLNGFQFGLGGRGVWEGDFSASDGIEEAAVVLENGFDAWRTVGTGVFHDERESTSDRNRNRNRKSDDDDDNSDNND